MGHTSKVAGKRFISLLQSCWSKEEKPIHVLQPRMSLRKRGKDSDLRGFGPVIMVLGPPGGTETVTMLKRH